METLKKSWKWVVGVVGAIVGLLMLRNFFQKGLKAELKNAETSKQDAVIETKKTQVVEDIKKIEAANKANADKLEADKKLAQGSNPSQVEDFWKKN
jgi:hypothetical protein